MKKKLLIGVVVLIVTGLLAIRFYGESILGSLLTSTLKSQYGIVLESSDIDFTFRPGGVSFDTARMFDAGRSASDSFFSAKRIGIGLHFLKAFRGDIALSAIHADELNIEIRRTDKGKLELAGIAQRFIPKQDSPANDSTPPSKTSKKPLPIPNIVLQSTQINYYAEGQENIPDHSFALDKLILKPKQDYLEISGAQVSQRDKNSPLLEITQLSVANLSDESKDLEISGEGIRFQAVETASGQYNFKPIRSAWEQVYRDIETILPPTQSSQSKREIGVLKLKNIAAEIAPEGNNKQSAGTVRIQADSVTLSERLNKADLTGVRLEEAGQPALTFDRLALTGIRPDHIALENIELEGLTIDVREDAKNQLNIKRAIQRIQNLIQSFIPETGKTAKADPPDFSALKHVQLSKIQVAYHLPADTRHQIGIESVSFDGNSGKGELKNLTFTSTDRKENAFLSIPTLSLVRASGKTQGLDLLSIEDLELNALNDGTGWDIIQAVSDLTALPERMNVEFAASSSPQKKQPFSIKAFQLSNARMNLTDTIKSYPIAYKANPINMRWNDLTLGTAKPPMGALNLESKFSEPCPIVLTFAGKAAPSADPVNTEGDASLSLGNLAAFERYYQDVTPLGIDRGGLSIDGHLKITDNQMDSVFDMTLMQPSFNASKGKWPIKIDGLTAVTALNGMKDDEGLIVFPDNKLKGNIRDPQFDLGIGIQNILARNIESGLTNVLKLPGAAAELGTDIVKKGAGSVGNAAEQVGDALGGAVNKLFGGGKKKP